MCRLNKRTECGFTLVELLLTLVVLTVFLSLVIVPLHNVLKTKQIASFFSVFEADVFYIQTKVLNTTKTDRIIFDTEDYAIIGDGNKRIYTREVPQYMHIANREFRIQFNTRGTILQPQTYRLYTDEATYSVVFPLGKGRHYIEKNE